jgi:hypothetical protein
MADSSTLNYDETLHLYFSLICFSKSLGVPSCRGFFGPYTICFVGYIVISMYPHTIIYFVSCTLDLCGPYVASEMTNSKLFQKIQKFPKKPKFDKKSLILANFFWLFLAFLFFWKILDFVLGYKNRT